MTDETKAAAVASTQQQRVERALSPEPRAQWAIEDRAWHAGRRAMSRMERREACPYPEGLERDHWLRGWDDAAHEWG